MKEVLIALITLVGVLVPALLSFLIENRKLKKVNRQLSYELTASSFTMDLMLFNQIKDIVQEIFERTKADRFLILNATNGKQELQFATAIYEHHKHSSDVKLSIGATSRYVHFKFDDSYRAMLKQSENVGPFTMHVDSMRDCDLKSIYKMERVHHSTIFFLLRAKLDNDNDKIFYATVATHEKEDFLPTENVFIRAQMGKMQSLVHSSLSEQFQVLPK